METKGYDWADQGLEGAAVAPEKTMSRAKARKERGEKARTDMAIILLRRGAISRA